MALMSIMIGESRVCAIMRMLYILRGNIRFAFLIFIVFVVNCLAWPYARAAEYSRYPDPETLKSGDLVWPKFDGDIVPFSDGIEEELESDSEIVMRCLTRLSKRQIDKMAQSLKLASETLLNLGRQAWAGLLYDGQPPSRSVEFAADDFAGVYVGHVGILERDVEGNLWVLEATRPNVRRLRYEEWLNGYEVRAAKFEKPFKVWHARPRKFDLAHGDAAADSFVRIAKSFAVPEKAPYDVCNFDLLDSESMYCSKLVWYSYFRATGFAIDGNRSTRRSFWLTPKMLLRSPRINVLHSPGAY